MDFLIRTDPKELDSTGYIEIGPGRYSGKHWTSGFLFIWEDAFGMTEGIIMRHFSGYDHFATNDIPREVGLKIVHDWNTVASEMESLDTRTIHARLHLGDAYRDFLESEMSENKAAIQLLLTQLSKEVAEYYENNDYACVLGI